MSYSRRGINTYEAIPEEGSEPSRDEELARGSDAGSNRTGRSLGRRYSRQGSVRGPDDSSGHVIDAVLEYRFCVYGYSVLFLALAVLGLAFHIKSRVSQQTGDVVGSDYDYIIVGGGPAGSVMARKLSDDPSKKVLLLEAGGPSQHSLGGKQFTVPPLTMFDVPLYWSSVAHVEDFHWPVEGAMIARALGGCGIHNAMLYVRALEEDFQSWDIPGWDWDTALSYYKKLENYTGPASDYHGTDGPIQTSPPAFVDEVAPYFVQACKTMGIKVTSDFNAPGERLGAGYYHFNIRGGVRDSAARVFLGPVLGKRKNLEVILGAEVQKVLISSANSRGGHKPQAYGVTYYSSDGTRKEVKLREGGAADSKGVIITAGAIHTPKLLMLSGVGPSSELNRYGIPVVQDAPHVGASLQDHPGIGMTFEVTPEVAREMPGAFTSYIEDLNKYKDWVMQGAPEDGPAPDPTRTSGEGLHGLHMTQKPFKFFASSGLTAGAFLTSEGGAAAVEGYPDIQLTVFPRVTEPHLVGRANDTSGDDGQSQHSILITIALLDPQARYSVHLNDHNPWRGSPVLTPVDPGLLSPQDVRKLVWALRTVRVLTRMYPMNEATTRELTPGPQVIDEDALERWVVDNRFPNSHWCGSARMGRANDPTAVVDERLRVIGVDSLRVADASIIPRIPNGNVHSTVLFIAARGADLMMQDARDSAPPPPPPSSSDDGSDPPSVPPASDAEPTHAATAPEAEDADGEGGKARLRSEGEEGQELGLDLPSSPKKGGG